MTKTISFKQSASVSRQAEARIPAAGDDRIWFKAPAAKSAAPCLIFCIVFIFGINPERASALTAQSSVSLAGPRFMSDRGFTNGRTEDQPGTNGLFSGDGNGMFQNLGVALFVSGLSPYLPQDSPRQPGLPDQPASARESRECMQTGGQRRFPLYLEILASVLLFGLISWGDAMWIGRQ